MFYENVEALVKYRHGDKNSCYWQLSHAFAVLKFSGS